MAAVGWGMFMVPSVVGGDVIRPRMATVGLIVSTVGLSVSSRMTFDNVNFIGN
jgi:hypothetical protein